MAEFYPPLTIDSIVWKLIEIFKRDLNRVWTEKKLRAEFGKSISSKSDHLRGALMAHCPGYKNYDTYRDAEGRKRIPLFKKVWSGDFFTTGFWRSFLSASP